MRVAVLLALAILAACEGGMTPPTPVIDGSVLPPIDAAIRQCEPDPGQVPNYFGESCTEAPFPAVTVCHGGAGWCIAGTCRPQCMYRRPGCACDFGVAMISARSACYCSPPE